MGVRIDERFSDRKCKLHFHNEDILDESMRKLAKKRIDDESLLSKIRNKFEYRCSSKASLGFSLLLITHFCYFNLLFLC